MLGVLLPKSLSVDTPINYNVTPLNSNINMEKVNKLKIIIDENGDKVVVISDVFFSKSKIRRKYGKVAKVIKNMFAEIEGQCVVIEDNNKKIYFDKHTSGEYVWSRDTINSKIINRTAKLNAVKEIKTIVQNAKYISHEELIESKRKAKEKRGIDSSKGFDYYNVKFAFEKENDKYQLFSGILNVRINKNSKNFFYDITKISESRMASGKPLSEPLENSDIL